MRQRKKQIERYHLEKFISNEILGLIVYKIKEDETPDFSLKLEEKLVSIEHTLLVNPDLQQKEKYKDKIIQEAQKLFENKYNERLYAMISFQENVLQFGKKYEKEYINHVFEFVERLYLNNQKFEFELSSKLSEEITDLIEGIHIHNRLNFSHWQHFGAYTVDQIDKEWFKGVIHKKEQNIKNYKEIFDENWLLLVSDFGTEASTKSFRGFDFSEITTQFDKIYLYSYMSDKITVVK